MKPETLALAISDAPLSAVAGANEEWPLPDRIEVELHPVPAFTEDLLPGPLAALVTDAAERMQCPPEFIAVGAMMVPAAIIGASCFMRPKLHDDDFVTAANLWGAIIGPPSVMKSPALKQALRPLTRLAATARDDFEAKQEEHDFDRKIAEARDQATAKAVKDAVSAGKSDDEIRTLRASSGERSKPPVERRYLSNDATVEKLGELLNQNPRGLLVNRDELTGFLMSLEKSGHEQDRAFYLEAWNGTNDGFTYDRIGRGTIHIKTPCVSLIGGIQPGPMRRYVADCVKGSGGNDGLMQRFQLLVYPDISKQWQLVDRQPDEHTRAMFAGAIEKLDRTDSVLFGAKIADDGQRFIKFAPEAQEFFYDWLTRHEQRLRRLDDHECIIAHLTKYRSLMPKLAMLIHFVEAAARATAGSDQGVSLSAAQMAASWCAFLEPHARRVYGLGLRNEAATATHLIRRLRALAPEFAARDVYRKGWAGLTELEDVQRALVVLEEAGYVRRTEVPTPGRTATRWRVNPRFAELTEPTKETEAPSVGSVGAPGSVHAQKVAR